MRSVIQRVFALAVLSASFGAAAEANVPIQAARSAQRAGARESSLGPEMTEYMSFLDSEEAELKYYLDGHEMPAAQYRVAKDKLDVTRAEALRIARERGDDAVPELYVMQAEELTQILADGVEALAGKKPGDAVGDNWLFHARVRRSVVLYVLERTGGIKKATGL